MIVNSRHWLLACGFALALASLLPAQTVLAQAPADRPPAATLSAPTSASLATDAAGFLKRWLILEPIPVGAQLNDSAVRATVAANALPSPATEVAEDGDRLSMGDASLTWHAVDTELYNVNLYHFAYALGKPTSNVLFWVETVVDSPREMQDVRLAIGSNAASVWWLNGEEVIAIYNDRQAVIDDGVSRRVTLREGRNVIRAAIINAGGATDFCARFLDADGEPIRDLVVRLAPAD